VDEGRLVEGVADELSAKVSGLWANNRDTSVLLSTTREFMPVEA